MTNADKAFVLVPGKLTGFAIGRIETELEMVRIERADPALVTPELADRVVGVAAMTAITGDFIDALPNLQIIANYGVGYDGVDAVHAARRGVVVTNTPDVLSDEVADTAIGLLINTLRELPKAEAYLREGRWRKEGAYPLSKGSLRGRSAGIYGLGRIGIAIARRLEAFGLPVSYHNRRRADGVDYAYHSSLLDLACAVDTLISVVPATPETENSVNREVLEALGPEGVFINVGRGTTVDEPALIRALSDGTIMAAGLDVFANEPEVPPELTALPNACLLPHVASASRSTRKAMADLMVDNLVQWFNGGRALTPVAECVKLNEGRAAS
jgi:lactate dehydrogenase-like 2-hydroxyacid dehydrogenase